MLVMSFKRLLTKSLYGHFHTGINTLKCKSVEDSIRNKLQAALKITHLNVINESSTHDSGNHEGSETHYRLVVVTDKFHGLPMYKRYNLVNDILKEELQSGNKFTIVAKTSIQWHRSLAAKEFPPSSDSGGVN